MKKVLVTCPPMLGQIDAFRAYAGDLGIDLHAAKVEQTLSEDELCQILPEYHGWIIGDDPATRRVFETARDGNLIAAVKWGVGVDNVDFEACRDLGIPVTNTPMMFGSEVADVAIGYVIGLARDLFMIDRSVRRGDWVKPAGISLQDRNVGVVGLGDIGRHSASRLAALGMNVVGYDPKVEHDPELPKLKRASWPDGVGDLDYLVFTCALNPSNYHMLNADILSKCKNGVRIVNVARGPLIDESSLIEALKTGQVAAAALDVFEDEPISTDNPLLQFEQCIFGTHNGSNTVDAVAKASVTALEKMAEFLSDSANEYTA